LTLPRSLFIYDGMLIDDLLAPHEYLALVYPSSEDTLVVGKTERGFFRVIKQKVLYVKGASGEAINVSLFTQVWRGSWCPSCSSFSRANMPSPSRGVNPPVQWRLRQRRNRFLEAPPATRYF
jgi:hypothetical protein